MDWLKRNGTVLALLLCCGLFVAVAWQAAAVGRLRGELEDSRAELGALTKRLAAAEDALEAGPAFLAWFENPRVDTENRLLTVDVRAELPGSVESVWVALCANGEPYGLGWQFVSLQRQAEGACAETVTFPLELDGGPDLTLEDGTALYSSDTMAPLLPLQLEYGSGSYHYDNNLQLFYQCEWSVKLTDPRGEDAQVVDPEYRVYQNETLLFAGPDFDPEGREVTLESLGGLSCKPGDRMRTCFACTDAFGLRYEFTLQEWAITARGAVPCPRSSRPRVAWPA